MISTVAAFSAVDLLEYWPVVVVVSVVAIIIAVRFSENQRGKAFRAFAEANNFGKIKRPREGMKRIALLRRGYSRTFKNSYETVYNDTVTIRVFDYAYTFGVPMISTVTTSQSVVAFRVGGPDLPEFSIAPLNSVGKMGKVLGRQGIVPPCGTTFTQRYILTGRDAEAIKMSIRPEAIYLLEQAPKGQEWNVESGDGWLAFYQHSRMVDAAFIKEWMLTAVPLANAFWGYEHLKLVPAEHAHTATVGS